MTRGQIATIGEQFGKLTVLRSGFRADPTPAQCNRMVNGKHCPMLGNLLCEVICECGTKSIVRQHGLRTGATTTCGCGQREAARRNGLANKTHGMKKHPSYSRHSQMMARCYNPSNHKYYTYGALGIRVDESWHDVATYCNWLDSNLGPCPEGYSLDRINNNGNYEPGNVRWASAATQANNRGH